MSEPAIQPNRSESERLLLRGIAAAKGGQRQIAVALLQRCVRLDPQNERAWLWLSGVLDDPQQVRFCLETVLQIRPDHPAAQRGLSLLAQRQVIAPAPVAALPINPSAAASAPEPLPKAPSAPWWAQRRAGSAPATRDEPVDLWWARWRRDRHDWRRASLVLWLLPLAIVGLALLVNAGLASLVAQRNAQIAASETANAPLLSPVVEVPVAPPTVSAFAFAAGPAMLESEPLAVRESRSVAYLTTIDLLRERMRGATESYREATSRPGGASVAYASAAQSFRQTLSETLDTMRSIVPPRDLAVAHADYLAGIELQIEGLDALLDFYAGYNVADANRAAIRLEAARAYIERAQASLQQHAAQIGDLASAPLFQIR